MIFNKFISFGLLSISSVIFISCGGGEDEVVNAKDNSAGNTNEETLPSVDTKTETEAVSEQVPEEEVEETQVVPNPNGVYLPTGEERNGQPVYENQEGFSMWFDGVLGKLLIKQVGARLFPKVKPPLMIIGSGGGKASFYPDEEYAKDATFRLAAVAFQGSQEDNKNAIRLFEQFVMEFPNDKLSRRSLSKSR